MRLNLRILVSILAALACIIFALAGCSDDDTGTSSINYGSLEDPEFVVVQDQINMFIDSTVNFFGQGLGTLQGISSGDGTIIPVQYAVSPDGDDFVEVTYDNGWHVIYITQHEGTYATTLRDSVQYLRNGLAQQSVSGLDQLRFKHYWDFDVVDTNVTHSVLVGHNDYTFANLNTALATINGSNALEVYSKSVFVDSTIRYNFDIEASLDDFTVRQSPFSGWSNCPVAGAINATFEATYRRDAETPVTTTWEAELTFDNGQMLALVTSGDITWRYECDVCNVPQ